MKKVKKILSLLFYSITIILIVLSLLSIFRNAEIRYFKILDFPRIQFFIFTLFILVIFLFAVNKKKWFDYFLIVGLVCALIINGIFLINYTCLVSEEVPTAKNVNVSDKISILVTNVKMSNRNAKPLIDVIDFKSPDLILAMEVDQWWNDNLSVLKEEYPYSQHTVNEVAYGMVLYSKLPIKEIEVKYLNNKNVPSFESVIELSEGKYFSFHALHPVPPTHFEKLPDNANQKETALIQLGKKIENRKFPTVVAGDLNDVVWSYVDQLTNTDNLLYDVRVGRGFYNSFDAESILMRWPLDHVFVTEEFRLHKLERLSSIDSDHFPLYVELVL